MILITGGCGYIGSHTAAELFRAGEEELVLVDNLCNSTSEVADRILLATGKVPYFYKADVRDREALRRIFRERQIDAVIHFAGLKAVGESVREPLRYYENNLESTLSLLEIMAEFDCRRIVFSSSATVYGKDNPIPYREDMPVTPNASPYGWSKVMQEQILRDAAAANPSLSVALLRYFNPIGADKSGLLGEDPSGIPNNLMPYICRVVSGRLPELRVFGGDYPTPDGSCVRDYIHVTDLAIGHCKALKYLKDHTGVLTLNLGTGKGCSVLELVHTFEKESGRTVPYTIVERRPGDLPAFFADASLAEKLLGWRAERDLAEMCRDAWNYTKLSMK